MPQMSPRGASKTRDAGLESYEGHKNGARPSEKMDNAEGLLEFLCILMGKYEDERATEVDNVLKPDIRANFNRRARWYYF